MNKILRKRQLRMSCVLLVLCLTVSHILKGITVHQEEGKTVLSLTPEECLNLTIKASSGETVNYVGGVDTEGNPVAPADIGSSSPASPRYITIFIEPLLAKYLGSNNPIVTDFARKAEAGRVVVDLKNNQAFYNGQPLFDVPAALLEKACRGQVKPSVASSTGEVVGW